MICRACGRPIPDQTVFCPLCGADNRVEAATSGASSTPPPQAQPSSYSSGPAMPPPDAYRYETPENTSMPMAFFRFYMVYKTLAAIVLSIYLLAGVYFYFFDPVPNDLYTMWVALDWNQLLWFEIIFVTLRIVTSLGMRICMPKGKELGLYAYYADFIITLAHTLNRWGILHCFLLLLCMLPIFIYFRKRKHLFTR